MTDNRQAELLARWLQQEPGQEPPVDLDGDAVEAVYALRPDRAPPPRLTIEQVLAEVRAGPLADPQDADAAAGDAAAVAALADWLEGNPGAEPGPEVDPDIVEAVYALRPDLAPAPRLSMDDIFGAVTTGPFASAPAATAAARTDDAATTASAAATPTAPADPRPRTAAATPRRRGDVQRKRSAARWLVPGLGGLAVAATALMLVLPGSKDALHAPSPFSPEATLAEEARSDAGRPAARPAAGPTAGPTAQPAVEAGEGSAGVAAPPAAPPAPQGSAAAGRSASAGDGATSGPSARVRQQAAVEKPAGKTEPTPPADVRRRLQDGEDLVVVGGSTAPGGAGGMLPAAGMLDFDDDLEQEERVAEDTRTDAAGAGTMAVDAADSDDELDAVVTETASSRVGHAGPKADRAERKKNRGPVLPLLSRAKEAPAADEAPLEPEPEALSDPGRVDAAQATAEGFAAAEDSTAAAAPAAEESTAQATSADAFSPAPAAAAGTAASPVVADAPAANARPGALPGRRGKEPRTPPDLAELRAAAWPLSPPPDVTAGRPDVAAAYAAAAAAPDDDAWLVIMRPLLAHADADVARDAAFRVARRQLALDRVNDALATISTGLRRGESGIFAARLFALRGEAWEALGATESAVDAYARAIEAR